jgi:hypothetical protein
MHSIALRGNVAFTIPIYEIGFATYCEEQLGS